MVSGLDPLGKLKRDPADGGFASGNLGFCDDQVKKICLDGGQLLTRTACSK
jgi:hypothetical protein